MKRTIITILLFLLLTGCSKDQIIPYEQIDFAAINIDETDRDYEFLKNAPFFANGGVSYSGRIPDEIYAWGRLMKKTNALDYFYKLESEANNEGKLYALCGLYYLDNENYDYLMKKYGSTDEKVSYMSGCVRYEGYSINELIKCNGKSVVRLKNNEDTVEDWLERNKRSSFAIDFYGGSIPYLVMKYAYE